MGSKYSRTWTGWMLFGLMLLVSAALVSCGPGDPGASSEKRALEAYGTLTNNAQVEAYALQLAGRSTSEASGALLAGAAGKPAYDVSLAALRGLGERDVPGGLEALQQAFGEKRGGLKAVAAIALARHGETAAVDWLVEKINDGTVQPGPEVLLQLVESGQTDLAKEILGKGIQSKDTVTRDQSYAVLGAVQDRWATLLLLQGMDKEHGERRREAIVALGNTGDPEVASRVAKYVNTQGLVFVALEALGKLGNPDSVATLTKSAGHEEELVRVYAGSSLWKLGEADLANETLAPLLASEDDLVRAGLAEQLDTVEDARALEMLSTLASDPVKDVRRAALLSLMEGGSAAQLPTFLAGAQDADYDVAAIALEAVGRWGGPDDLAALEPLLDSENPYLAVGAANAILEIRARTAPAKG